MTTTRSHGWDFEAVLVRGKVRNTTWMNTTKLVALHLHGCRYTTVWGWRAPYLKKIAMTHLDKYKIAVLT